ncbi:hypothetical protein VC83_04982 [Pseudogymnoascus destructans]|uniref:Fungal lipase-type domain-containing protein n=1 Tax=Pseudogymnoascus destructans TaxID=655981 RepID=A0A177ABP8_9PEZI|nr:uncharacterized protein VC83_04982 [Pseudogymnoascus destructans]OAF58604.1 hypothetical protein VC83_04982 [Pseudogymnoascus destructans]
MHIPTAAALPLLLLLSTTCATVAGGEGDRTVSEALFADLEEAARLADIAYCVGISGIWKPFGCLSRCSDFEDFELVDTWNTGPLRSDSCGYIALDHAKKRIVVAFRGTYSLASVLADLATTPQVYVPYPEPPPPPPPPPPSKSKPRRRGGWFGWIPRFGERTQQDILATAVGDGDGDKHGDERPVCTNCTVHAGFLKSWSHTRPFLLSHLTRLARVVPDYEIHLIGHSLGGALAALAGLELRAGGVEVVVTTFGEPRIGNKGLVGYLDSVFELAGEDGEGGEGGMEGGRFRRVTHVGDPVPLLPPEEWGYAMHGGEIYILRPGLPVGLGDVERCVGDADGRCIAGSDGGVLDGEAVAVAVAGAAAEEGEGEGEDATVVLVDETVVDGKGWGVPARFRVGQILFAHRDYFWRVGVCVPGGDPAGWGRGWYRGDGGDGGGMSGKAAGDEL